MEGVRFWLRCHQGLSGQLRRNILERRDWNGFSFPVLPPEETLLLLSVHGAKHLWCKLAWLCDVAGLLTSERPPDLDRCFELARRCGVTRLLCLTLLLAERVAGVSMPGEISARVGSDFMASSLMRQVLAVIKDNSDKLVSLDLKNPDVAKLLEKATNETDIRKVFAEKPGEFDPRKYLGPARIAVKELVRHKVKNVLCCAGHAFD